jgi:hypothetical protein
VGWAASPVRINSYPSRPYATQAILGPGNGIRARDGGWATHDAANAEQPLHGGVFFEALIELSALFCVLPVRVQKIFNQGQELRRMELWGLRAATVLD